MSGRKKGISRQSLGFLLKKINKKQLTSTSRKKLLDAIRKLFVSRKIPICCNFYLTKYSNSVSFMTKIFVRRSVDMFIRFRGAFFRLLVVLGEINAMTMKGFKTMYST